MNIIIKDNNKPVRPPIKFKDLKDGDIVQWKFERDSDWNKGLFLIVEKKKLVAGQTFNLSSKSREWFSHDDDRIVFRVFNTMEVSEPIEFVE
jgi:hypothetical protein